MFVFVETPLFTRLVSEYLSDDEYLKLQWALARNPEAGPIIPGSGGVRKLRWALPGRGKRGGLRVIYYVRSRQGLMWMLTLYQKTSPRTFHCTFSTRFDRILNMTKPRSRDIGAEILTGIQQLKRGEVGRVVTLPPVFETRARVGLSQSEFARLLGVSVRTLQEWEQGRRVPSGPARTLLAIAHRNPRALLESAV